MFCPNCGNNCAENQKFCKNCGTNLFSTESANFVACSEQNNTVVQQDSMFNRDVLINYLYNLQTLEFARHKMQDDADDAEYRIDNLGISRHIHKGEGAKDWLSWTLILGIAFAASVIVSGWLNGDGILSIFDFLLPIVNFIKYASLILGIISIFLAISDAIKDDQTYHEELEYEEVRLNNERCEKQELSTMLNSCYSDLKETERLLEEAYSLNIIPSKYRNLYAIYFIYDYLSTSISATLKDALQHCALDEISQKLDAIIENQREMIMLQARNNALSEQIVRQNDEILQRAIAIENNTALAAQYSRVAAINSQTVAQVQSYYFYKNG